MTNIAFWYKKNKLINVDKTHIDTIIKNPKLFGITFEEIEDIFSENGEPFSLDLDNDNTISNYMICKKLYKNGWIKIRVNTHSSSKLEWWITCDNIKSQMKDLKDLIYKLLMDEELMQEDDYLTIYECDSSKNINFNNNRFSNNGISSIFEM